MTKTNRLNKRHKNSLPLDSRVALIMLTFTFLWFIPFINKGIDYTDASYNLAVFNRFYSTGGTSIGMFITNFIGGTICLIAQSHQYLLFRILYWITYVAISLLIYFSFNKVIPKIILSGCIFIGFFMIKHGTTFMAYNSLSSLGLALLIFVLSKAFEMDKDLLCLWGGFIVGINTFVRLPNVLQFGFVVAIIWYYGFISKSAKKATVNSLLFISGGISGSIICIFGYLLKNNASNLIASANSYATMAADSSNSHGILKMISKFITQFISAIYVSVKHLLPLIAILLTIVSFIIFILSRISKRKLTDYKLNKTSLISITAITAIASIAYAALCLNSKTDYRVYMYILGLSNLFLGIVCAIIFRDRSPKASISAVLCACVSVTLAFGSDNIMNTFFTLFAPIVIGFTLCMYYIYKLGIFSKNTNAKRTTNKMVKMLALVLTVAIIFSSSTVFFMQLFPFTYGPYLNGNGSISELTTPVNQEILPLKGMKTTPERAEQINEFYSIMQDENLSSKEIAVFGYFPLAFSLCDNNSYFYSTWIDLEATTVSSMENTYLAKKAENNLPVIIVSYIYMNDINDAIITPKDKQEFLDRMLSENAYEVFYESENFTIYTVQ